MLQTSPRPSADFDFLMGIWRCRHRYLVRRLCDCHDWISFDGTCAVRKILNGFGNLDESEVAFPGDRHRAMNLRLYDWDRDRWLIQQYDSRRPGHGLPSMLGRFDKGMGTFLGEDCWQGKIVRARVVWSRTTAGSARWEQAFSLDEGKNWETNWVVDFTRV